MKSQSLEMRPRNQSFLKLSGDFNIEDTSLETTVIFTSVLSLEAYMWVVSHFSCVWLFAILWTIACQAPLSMGCSRQDTGVDYHAFLRGIFLTHESNPHLLCPLHWQAGSFPRVPPTRQWLSSTDMIILLLVGIVSLRLLCGDVG